jgi:hypothetical protein
LQLADQMARLKSRLHEAASGSKQDKSTNAKSTQVDSKQSGAAAEGGQSAESEAAADAKSVLKSIERSDPEAAMREIGGDVAQNNVGQAMARQQQLLDELRKLDHRLAQRPESDLKAVVQKMGQTEQQIDSLRKDQESLRKATQKLDTDKSQQNAKSLETLRKEQSRLREGTQEVTRELRRLGTEDSSIATGQAGSHMAEAEQQLEQAPTPGAQAEQGQAIEQLNQAQAALKRAKREAASQLAQQSAMKIVDEVAGLVARQKTVLDETKRLDAERAQQSNWTRGQLRSLQTVARLERQLQEETGKTAERLAEAEAYSFVLKRATEEIQSAADRLSNKLTDAKTVSLENEAWSRLRNIVQALKAESKPNGPQQPESPPNPNAQNPPKPNIESDVPGVAQLQLLKITQQDLLRRTGDLDRQRREQAQAPATAANDELERLSREQGELAGLIQRLASRFFNERDGEHQIESPQRHK